VEGRGPVVINLIGVDETILFGDELGRTEAETAVEVRQSLEFCRRNTLALIDLQALDDHLLDLVGQLGLQLAPTDRNRHVILQLVF
jgi:hypothetical protein